jgi:site-specific DNA recombinase
MRKVVGYGRVSTQLQIAGTSPEEQILSIKEECSRKGYDLVEFYSDNAFSGSDDNRPGLQKMLSDVQLKKIQTVIFTKLDRLGRNLRDIKNILHEITNAGLTFICIQQPEINNEGFYGNLLLNILGAFAEFERSMIKDRTTRGRIIKWKEGNGAIGSLPLGYARVNEEICVHKENAEIYQKIVSMYLDENYNMLDIAIKLAAQGITSPSGRSTKWSNATVGNILKNTAYTGEGTQNQFEYVKQTNRTKKKQYYTLSKIEKPKEQWISIKYPPLVTQERFDQIKDKIKNQKRKPKKHHKGHENHFMAENVLFCGYCKSRIRKYITSSSNFSYCCYWWQADEKTRLVNKHQKCLLKPIDADDIDNEIFIEVAKVLSRPIDYAKDWLRNADVEGLKKSVEMLKKREVELNVQLTEGLRHIMNTTDSELKKIYNSEIKKKEDDYKLNQKDLRNAEATFTFAQNNYDRLAEFEKALNGGKAKRIRALSSTVTKVNQYLFELPITEKKRIMEAVIAPANGGRVFLRYGTKEEDCEGEIIFDWEFDLDMNRNESLINNLNKKDLFNKVGVQ